MTRFRPNGSRRIRQTGVSLVELMVALVVGLVLTSGIIQIYLGTKSGYAVQEGLSRLQENARFAFGFLTRDLRMAGESGGCRNLNEIEPNVIAKNFTSSFGSNDFMKGFEAGDGWTNPTGIDRVGDSDVLVVRRAATVSTELTGNMKAVNANVQITINPAGFEADDVLFISDCESADIFRATNVSSGGSKITIAHSKSANITNFLSKAYDTQAQIMRFEENTYFIGENPDGHPSLYKIDLEDNAQELIEGIEDMQIRYGLDTAGDRSVNEYRAADAVPADSWHQVVAVEIDLLVRTRDEVSTTETDYTFDFEDVDDPGDRRLRRWFSTTVTLRNIAL